MTILALLTKEMRLRLRREQTIWLIMLYILVMGTLGWFSLNNDSNYNNPTGNGLSTVGLNLYGLLATLQLFLIIFITPSFTATAINGEKERQTFDMLLSAHLSAFSLVMGKLIAGLANSLLLIAAAIPIFSLVFFFGGVSLAQVAYALTVFVATTFLVSMFGLFCSTIFRRPITSTVITYSISLFWALFPLLLSFILLTQNGNSFFASHITLFRLLFTWNPIAALLNTYSNPGSNLLTTLLGYGANTINYGGTGVGPNTPYMLLGWSTPSWLVYTFISSVMTVILFVLCLVIVSRHPFASRAGRQTKRKQLVSELEDVADGAEQPGSSVS